MSFQPITPILGVLLLALAWGMAYIRWINPKSPSEHALRARWRDGTEASPLGALVQVLILASAGIGMIAMGFNIRYGGMFLVYVVGPIAMITLIARFFFR